MRYWWSVLIVCVMLQLLMEAINGCSVFLAQLHLGTLLFEEIYRLIWRPFVALLGSEW